MVNRETKRALEVPSLGCPNATERNLPGNDGTRVPLVIKQNPFRSRAGQVIQKNLCFTHQDEKFEQVFTLGSLELSKKACLFMFFTP